MTEMLQKYMLKPNVLRALYAGNAVGGLVFKNGTNANESHSCGSQALSSTSRFVQPS
jgi:hypothetical protein